MKKQENRIKRARKSQQFHDNHAFNIKTQPIFSFQKRQDDSIEQPVTVADSPKNSVIRKSSFLKLPAITKGKSMQSLRDHDYLGNFIESIKEENENIDDKIIIPNQKSFNERHPPFLQRIES